MNKIGIKAERSELVKQEQYQIMSEMLAKSATIKEMADKLGISKNTVLLDKETILERMRRETKVSIERYKALELHRIEAREREAWSEYERSKGEKKKVTQNIRCKDDKGKVVTKQIVTETSCGDPRYLDVIARCSKDRRELLGMDALIRSGSATVIVSCKLPDGFGQPPALPGNQPILEIPAEFTEVGDESDKVSD